MVWARNGLRRLPRFLAWWFRSWGEHCRLRRSRRFVRMAFPRHDWSCSGARLNQLLESVQSLLKCVNPTDQILRFQTTQLLRQPLNAGVGQERQDGRSNKDGSD